MFLGSRFEHLGVKEKLFREHGQLARIGAAESPLGSDQVSQIEQLRQLKILIANLLLANENLDLAGPVADFAGQCRVRDCG